MHEERIKRGKTLSEQLHDALYEDICQLSPGNNRLPSEEELAKKYGVSRAIVREACNQLRLEGYLSRRGTRGMVGHPSACKLKNRIDLVSDFRQLVGQNCREVELRISDVRVERCAEYQGLFVWGEDVDEIFCMTWDYYGDGQPVIRGKFEIPISAFRVVPELSFHVDDLIEFGEKYLNNPVAYFAMQVHCAIDQQAAEHFGISPDRPMQCWRETLYDLEDNAFGYSIFYLHPDNMVMSVLTKF